MKHSTRNRRGLSHWFGWLLVLTLSGSMWALADHEADPHLVELEGRVAALEAEVFGTTTTEATTTTIGATTTEVTTTTEATTTTVGHGEPHAPIVALRLRLGEYPDLSTEMPCVGGVADFDKLRVEGLIDVADTPSEHWITRIEFAHDVPGSPGNWDSLYGHQNVGPGNARRGNNFQQIAQNLQLGEWSVRFVVTGQESGVVLEEVCTFTHVAD